MWKELGYSRSRFVIGVRELLDELEPSEEEEDEDAAGTPEVGEQ